MGLDSLAVMDVYNMVIKFSHSGKIIFFVKLLREEFGQCFKMLHAHMVNEYRYGLIYMKTFSKDIMIIRYRNITIFKTY